MIDVSVDRELSIASECSTVSLFHRILKLRPFRGRFFISKTSVLAPARAGGTEFREENVEQILAQPFGIPVDACEGFWHRSMSEISKAFDSRGMSFTDRRRFQATTLCDAVNRRILAQVTAISLMISRASAR